MIGVEAYFGAGDAMRQALEENNSGLPLEMLSECIKSIIQVESLICRERGYPSLAAYEKYWEDFYNNSNGKFSNLYRSCRYYSNLHRVVRRWADLMKCHTRYQRYYNLHKSITFHRLPGGNLLATCTFCDSFHELEILLTLDRTNMQVLNAGGCFLRAPNEICFETSVMITGLKGVSLSEPCKKTIAGIVGGTDGCSHLVDLVYGAAKALKDNID